MTGQVLSAVVAAGRQGGERRQRDLGLEACEHRGRRRGAAERLHADLNRRVGMRQQTHGNLAARLVWPRVQHQALACKQLFRKEHAGADVRALDDKPRPSREKGTLQSERSRCGTHTVIDADGHFQGIIFRERRGGQGHVDHGFVTCRTATAHRRCLRTQKNNNKI
jgi:hypothetical protein